MNYRDLRADTRKVPVYDAAVFVRADIALDRAFCLNEVEACAFLRNRIEEVSPFSVKKIGVSHKDRKSGASIWEAEIALQGTVQIDQPLPRPEVQRIVQDLVKRVGFENSNVEVRGLQKNGNVENPNPDERDFQELSKKAMKDRLPAKKAPAKAEDMSKLKKGDRVVITKAGFTEEGQVVNILPEDELVEVDVMSSANTVWIPFTKILEVLPFRYVDNTKKMLEQVGDLGFAAIQPLKGQVKDGELEKDSFISQPEFRSRVMSEEEMGRWADKAWTTAEEFEKEFPGVIEGLVEKIELEAKSLGEQEVGVVSKTVGLGDRAHVEEAEAYAQFDDAESTFSEAFNTNNRLHVIMKVEAPIETGEYKVSYQ